MNRYLVVATEDELQLPWAQAMSDHQPIVTGVGGTNVIRALRDLPRDSEIFNVGYAGSLCYPVGSTQWVTYCRLWHPNVEFKEPSFKLSETGHVICLTAGDFVLDGSLLPIHTVVDMELAYIAAFGFAKLTAIKYISDNLNYKEYESSIESCKASQVFK